MKRRHIQAEGKGRRKKGETLEKPKARLARLAGRLISPALSIEGASDIKIYIHCLRLSSEAQGEIARTVDEERSSAREQQHKRAPEKVSFNFKS